MGFITTFDNGTSLLTEYLMIYYFRYKKENKRIDEGIEEKTLPCIPNPEPYPRSQRQPPTSRLSPEMVFFCRRVYDFRQKRIMKNPT